MFIGGVVYDQIDEQTKSALFTTLREFNKVPQGAISGIDAVVISDVVSIVPTRRGLKRHEPYGCDAHSLEIIQTSHQTLEVPNTVTVCIHIGGDRQTVDDGVLVPEIIDHGADFQSRLWIWGVLVGCGQQLGGNTGSYMRSIHARFKTAMATALAI